MRVEGIFSNDGVDSIVTNYTAELMGLRKKGDPWLKEFVSEDHKHNCYKAMDLLDNSNFMDRFKGSMCAYEDILIYAVEEILENSNATRN